MTTDISRARLDFELGYQVNAYDIIIYLHT